MHLFLLFQIKSTRGTLKQLQDAIKILTQSNLDGSCLDFLMSDIIFGNVLTNIKYLFCCMASICNFMSLLFKKFTIMLSFASIRWEYLRQNGWHSHFPFSVF